MAANNTGVVNIRGREYTTVARRVQCFREQHPDWSLVTVVLHRDAECVVVCATISDEVGRVRANGHAEEYRKASDINRTSALENCETSAIGRALAALGFGGTEFASADEVARAITGQKGEAATTSHSGPRITFDELQPEQQDWLRRAAPQIAAFVQMDKFAEARQLINITLDSFDDSNHAKAALWALLDSGTRSKIKRHESEKEAA
ncbi:MAG TPA: hypothetical protein PKD87_15305 [Burkholderiaceae bacterium]|nr:hypothetical protein [Burkholderiaceae bacterium]